MTKKLSNIGERIRFVRENLRYTRRQFCEKYLISESTLKSWENIDKNITENALTKILSLFNQEGVRLNRDWLLYNKGEQPHFHSAHLVNHEQEANIEPVEYSEYHDELLMMEDQTHFLKKYKSSVSTIISTMEMLPLYSPGDYVGGIKRTGRDIEKTVGRDCIIKIKDQQGLLVKRVGGREKSGLYSLFITNTVDSFKNAILTAVDIEYCAPIIWIRKKN